MCSLCLPNGVHVILVTVDQLEERVDRIVDVYINIVNSIHIKKKYILNIIKYEIANVRQRIARLQLQK